MKESESMKRILPWLGLGILLIVLAGLLGFVIWGSTPQAASQTGLQALVSDASVLVETDPWLTFTPAQGVPQAGMIIYPGGHVDPRAYAPLARQIAAQGYKVIVVPMPLALAVLAPDRADTVIRAHPDIKRWAIGGHSLGGAMAARFAYVHPGEVDGLVLWAAYPAASDDLSALDLRVASIYGTRDGLTTGDKIEASRALLPPDTSWVPIEGGNHAQFGDYGVQSGDRTASISAVEQQRQAAIATLAVLKSMGE
jgi:hypothetical protein